MAYSISLLPLDREYHSAALQAVYDATPSYWEMYGLPSAPPDQAEKDLHAANDTPGRFLLGIVKRVDELDVSAGAEMIGLVDLRLHWPEDAVAYVGMLMVAEPLQRQGIGSQAWSLLAPWLAASANIHTVRVGIEQFNVRALKFWEQMGFALTGESDRLRSGDRFVRLLYLQKTLPDTR
jgi:RimJ/RimL family protein N-acetyltransferase